MSLDDLQKQVDDWANQYSPAYWPPLEQLGRMTEELGELAREINHKYGVKKKKMGEQEGGIGKELTDIIFTAMCIANREGINLQKEWDDMMQKKAYGRDINRFEKKEEKH